MAYVDHPSMTDFDCPGMMDASGILHDETSG